MEDTWCYEGCFYYTKGTKGAKRGQGRGGNKSCCGYLVANKGAQDSEETHKRKVCPYGCGQIIHRSQRESESRLERGLSKTFKYPHIQNN